MTSFYTQVPYEGGSHGVPPSERDAPIKKFNTAINILAKKAVQNPEIVKPRTSDETSSNIKALITNKKNPSVINVNGKVRMINSGLTIALAKPSIKAEIISEDVSANRIPLNT